MANRIIDRLKRNYEGFWRSYRWLVVVFLLALLADAASTSYFMVQHGPDGEWALSRTFGRRRLPKDADYPGTALCVRGACGDGESGR